MSSTLKVDILQDSGGNNLVTSNGSGVITSAGFGKIGQVVQTKDTTETATTSSSYSSTPLAVSITPSSTSSKILILAQVSFRIYETSGSDASGYFSIYDGSSHVWENRVRIYDYGGSGSILNATNSYIYLDSPSTTSQKTYTIYQKLTAGDEIEVNPNNTGDSSITAMEILP